MTENQKQLNIIKSWAKLSTFEAKCIQKVVDNMVSEAVKAEREKCADICARDGSNTGENLARLILNHTPSTETTGKPPKSNEPRRDVRKFVEELDTGRSVEEAMHDAIVPTPKPSETDWRKVSVTAGMLNIACAATLGKDVAITGQVISTTIERLAKAALSHTTEK